MKCCSLSLFGRHYRTATSALGLIEQPAKQQHVPESGTAPPTGTVSAMKVGAVIADRIEPLRLLSQITMLIRLQQQKTAVTGCLQNQSQVEWEWRRRSCGNKPLRMFGGFIVKILNDFHSGIYFDCNYEHRRRKAPPRIRPPCQNLASDRRQWQRRRSPSERLSGILLRLRSLALSVRQSSFRTQFSVQLDEISARRASARDGRCTQPPRYGLDEPLRRQRMAGA